MCRSKNCTFSHFKDWQLCAGPLPLFNDPGHKGMIDHLQSLAASLLEPPKALVSTLQRVAFQRSQRADPRTCVAQTRLLRHCRWWCPRTGRPQCPQ